MTYELLKTLLNSLQSFFKGIIAFITFLKKNLK